MAYDNFDRRVVIYPTYINKKKTRVEGRKISAEKACEKPLATEIYDVVNFLKLPCEIELNKAYSREWWVQGRVRVQLKGQDGRVLNPDIPTRKALFLEVARLVPRHPNRQQKAQQEKEAKPAPSAAKSKHHGGKGKGKKGKK